MAVCLVAGCWPVSALGLEAGKSNTETQLSAARELTEAECEEIAKAYWNRPSGEGVTGGNSMTFHGKKYYNYILKWWVEDHWSAVDYLFVEAATGNCYYGLSEPEYRVIKVKGNETLSFEGILTQRDYEINSANKGTAYILKLDEDIRVKIFDSTQGYYGEAKKLNEIQVNFSTAVSKADIQKGLNCRIEVKGSAIIAHTGHHLTPVVLTESQIVSNTSSNGSDTDSPSLQQEFYFGGKHIATILLPEAWKGHLEIEKDSDSISFYSRLNKNASYGGRLFSIGVWSNDTWKNMSRRQLLKTFQLNGKQYDLILWGPTDVQHNHDDPACREEWLLMEGKEQEIIDNIIYHIDENASEPDTPNRFSDVSEKAYYYDAVAWAVENGITVGTDKTHFSPEQRCTRAQIVSFLWRADGSPEPNSSLTIFSDVKAGEYYEKAVRWAVEEGITNGTGKGKFSPEASCTRAQAVTFLWRAAGEPEPSGTAKNFTDVVKGSYYEKAVKWAIEKGITAGTGNGKFSPETSCTRAQIVSFLYRYAG